MMPAFVMGPIGLIFVLLFGGGMGLPLGIPPEPEDPLMARVAPEECLFYTSWAGTAEPDPASQNQTEQLLAEPEIRQMMAEIERAVTERLSQSAGTAVADDASKWGKALLARPGAIFLSSVKLGQTGPDVHAGALIRVDEDAPRLKTMLEKYQQTFLGNAAKPVAVADMTCYRITPGKGAPVITWGVRGKYLLAGVGEGAVEGILERARTAEPAWLAGIGKQFPIERRATVTYINLKTILDTFAPLAGPQAAAAIEAGGLKNVVAMASVTGLDKEASVNKTLLSLDGPPTGVLAALAGEPLQPADLAPVPRDATVALAARANLDAVLEAVLSAAAKIDPNAREEIDQGLGEMQEELGINLRDDLLKPLGNVWCLYNSPSEGGLLVTGLTLVVPVKDHQRLAATQARLIAKAKAAMDNSGSRRRGPSIEQFQFAGQDVYLFNAREKEFPLAPSWCLTEKELVVALLPQNVKAYLSRAGEQQSLAEVPEVAGLFGPDGGPVALSYVDTRTLFETLYPLVPMVAQLAMRDLGQEGLDINVSILPSAGAIGKHLRPAVVAVRRTESGIELLSRQTAPGGNLVAAAPIGAALLFPAVQSARGAARRASSMNNLKQFALALHVYHDAHKSFPPAFTADKDGKPLLSWRVAILPYIEQDALYKQFKLDEPWDSENNKKLIPMMPPIFKAPASKAGPGKTNYLAVRGEKTAFPGAKGVSLKDIPDGASNTVLLVEAGDQKAVVWTKPDDFQYDPDNPAQGLIGLRKRGFLAAFADGHVSFISQSVDAAINAMFTRNGGENAQGSNLR